jgi:hypothetical protein
MAFQGGNTFVFGEQPAASKWDQLWRNDDALADGTGISDNAIINRHIGDDAVKAAEMFYGMVRGRQGGTTGDNTWASSGTSNTDTSAKSAWWQVGAVLVDANPKTVTFPNAYNQTPIVLATTATASVNRVFPIILSVGTTNFTCRTDSDAGSTVLTEGIFWLAVGQ